MVSLPRPSRTSFSYSSVMPLLLLLLLLLLLQVAWTLPPSRIAAGIEATVWPFWYCCFTWFVAGTATAPGFKLELVLPGQLIGTIMVLLFIRTVFPRWGDHSALWFLCCTLARTMPGCSCLANLFMVPCTKSFLLSHRMYYLWESAGQWGSPSRLPILFFYRGGLNIYFINGVLRFLSN